MIEIHLTETDLLVEILTKLRFNGASFHAHIKGNKWLIEML